MNAGANVGVNHIYSGTVAAAIEAAFLGLPAIAVSLHLHKDVPVDYERAAGFAAEAIKLVLAAGLDPGEVVSINIPALLPEEEPAGVKIVRQCTRPFIDQYERRIDPRGREYFWNSSVFVLGDTEDDTDVAAIRDKYIAVTPLQFDLTNHAMTNRWRQRKWGLTKDSATEKRD
jgi:5'-nucleotidase